MIILEKLEGCPDCGERKFWFYDGQMCANCGYGEPNAERGGKSFHADRLDSWLKELWAAASLDLHMCDGSKRENQFGLLQNIRYDATALRRRLTAMDKLLVAARILLAHADACAMECHSPRNGDPKWLADCRHDIEAARRS